MALDTYSIIAPFQVFDTSITPTPTIAARYGFVWGANPNKGAAWKASNPNIDLSFYFKSWRDTGTYSNTTPLSLATWQATHPDWILYQSDEVTPAYQTGSLNVPLDFSNASVVSWQSSTYASPASASGFFTSMAADNLSLNNAYGASGAFKGVSNAWVQLYANINDPAYRANVGTWCSTFRADIQALSPMLRLVPNFNNGAYALTDPAVVAVVQNSDGILDEGFFSSPSLSQRGAAWVARVQFMQAVQQTYGKSYYVIYELPDNSGATGPIQYGLATYLMGKYHSAYIAIVPTISGSASYGIEYYRPEYTVASALGSPLEDMTLDASGVYRRRFAGGLVLVNNDATNSHTYTLSGGSFQDVDNAVYTGSISMAPVSALVLLPTNVALFPATKRRGNVTYVTAYASTVLADTPTAYYRLGEASGTVVHDSTSNHYDGTLNGGITLGQLGALSHDSDTSMLFNGTTGYSNLPSGLSTNGLAALSIECWFNATSTAGTTAIVSNSLPGSTNQGVALLNIGGTLFCEVGNGTTNTNPSIAIATATWYHVVLVFNGSTVIAYLNGTQVGSHALIGTVGATSNTMRIGAGVSGGTAVDFFSGLIDEVAIYSSALSATRITAHYQAGITSKRGDFATFPTATRRTGVFPTTKRRQS